MRKTGGNIKETGCLIQLASSTKVNHATRVITLQLKQPICIYSDTDILRMAVNPHEYQAPFLLPHGLGTWLYIP